MPHEERSAVVRCVRAACVSVVEGQRAYRDVRRDGAVRSAVQREAAESLLAKTVGRQLSEGGLRRV